MLPSDAPLGQAGNAIRPRRESPQRRELHLPEAMQVRIAHGQEHLAPFQPDPQMSAPVARAPRDRVPVDERAAMDLPAPARVEFRFPPPDRRDPIARGDRSEANPTNRVSGVNPA
jgi:hypothetical protein